MYPSCCRQPGAKRAPSAVALALSVLLLEPAAAAIAPGSAQSGANAAYSGNGELFLSVFDSGPKISYTLDLGVTLNDFFVWGQQDGGNQRFWPVDDAAWTGFLPQVSRASLRWSVLGFDTTGGTAIGGVRLFTTAQQGDEGSIDTLANQLFTNGTGSTQAGTFFSAVNTTGTHGVAGTALDFSANGSSVNAAADPGNGYFADNSVGLSTTLNGNAPFDSSNPVGRSSWFYFLTRSGPVQTQTVLVDEFDNLGHDGYWGFVFVDPALYPDSPHVGKYLLSYTLASYSATLAQREFAAGIGRTEASGGFAVSRLPGEAAAGLEMPAGWSTPLGGLDTPAAALPAAVSPVPEPASWALASAGLLWLIGRTRRRAR